MILLRDSKIKLQRSEDVAQVLQNLLKLEDTIEQDKEHYYVLHLDARHRLNLVEVVAIGTLTEARIHPRETFRRAVAEGSATIIIAHNHPSGDTEPSTDDILATRKLHEVGEIPGIPVLDHIVFTPTKFYSFTRMRGGELHHV